MSRAATTDLWEEVVSRIGRRTNVCTISMSQDYVEGEISIELQVMRPGDQVEVVTDGVDPMLLAAHPDETIEDCVGRLAGKADRS